MLKRIGKVTKWVATAFLLLFAIVMFTEGGFASGALFLACGAISCPLTDGVSKAVLKGNRRWLSVLIAFILLVAAFAFSPLQDESSDKETKTGAETTEVAHVPTESISPAATSTPETTHSLAPTEPKATTTVAVPTKETTPTQAIVPSATITPTPEDTILTVQYLDVGQGDSTLICCDGEYMLVDGGDKDYSSFVVSYLKKQGITELRYAIATHYDADHLHGILGVLNTFKVDIVIGPEDYGTDSKVYESFCSALTGKNVIYSPPIGTEYTLGGATFRIVGPYQSSDESNNNSIAFRLVHGNTSFLFCGDAQAEEEYDILDNNTAAQLKSDVYHVNHHGSGGSSNSSFLKAVNPTYAVISCGKENSYGHPHDGALDRLKNVGCKNLYRTDIQSTIIATSNGKTITFNVAPTTCWTPGDQEAEPTQTPTITTATESNEDVGDYIVNKNSNIIHLPTCSSVGRMNESNKLFYNDVTLQSLKDMGYDPCDICLE